MKKINILKKNNDFFRIISKHKFYRTFSYIISIEKKEQENCHFGISVSKKIGNAIVRNKLKRQIKNIIDKKCYENSFNCIIILRKAILTKSFNKMSEDLYSAFKTLNILKEEHEKE